MLPGAEIARVLFKVGLKKKKRGKTPHSAGRRKPGRALARLMPTVTATGKTHGTPTLASESTSGIHELGTSTTDPRPCVPFSLHNCHANYAGNAWSSLRVALHTDYGLLHSTVYLQSRLIFHPTSSSVRLYHTRLLACTLPPVLLFLNQETRTFAISCDSTTTSCLRCARRKQSAEIATIAGEEDKRSGRGGGGRPRGCWRERETYGVRTTPSIRPRKSLKDADACQKPPTSTSRIRTNCPPGCPLRRLEESPHHLFPSPTDALPRARAAIPPTDRCSLNASLSLLCDPHLPELESCPGPYPCFIRRRVTRDRRRNHNVHTHTSIHLPQRPSFRQFRPGGGLSHNDTLYQISPSQLAASPREPLRIRDSRLSLCIGPRQLALAPYPHPLGPAINASYCGRLQ